MKKSLIIIFICLSGKPSSEQILVPLTKSLKQSIFKIDSVEKALEKTSQFYLTAGYWRLFYNNGDHDERSLFNNFFMLDGSWYKRLGTINWSYYFVAGTMQAT